MSKASDLADQRAKVMVKEYEASFEHDRVTLDVSHNGRLTVRVTTSEQDTFIETRFTLEVADAVAMGRWLLDTFSESTSAVSPAGAPQGEPQ